MNKVTHQINRVLTSNDKYLGTYILIGFGTEEGGILYDTVKKRILSEFKFSHIDTYAILVSNYPVIIRNNRYLVTIDGRTDFGQTDNNYNEMVMYDLTTNQRQNSIKLSAANDHSSLYFCQENNYYNMLFEVGDESSLSATTINKYDYNNNFISKYTFNNFKSKLQGSFYLTEHFILDNGIIQTQSYEGQAWLIIYLFNNTLLQYRFDDGNYQDSYTFYLMNAKKQRGY